MTEAERLAGVVSESMPRLKRGSLRFWGSWFGRPHDNQHRIVGCEADGDLLVLRFDDGEILRVWGPGRATVDQATFRIVDARRVRWEWYLYGGPRTASNRRFEDFRVDGSEIRVETNFGSGPRLRADASFPAVEIH